MKPSHFESLLSKYHDNELSEVELQELQTVLSKDDAALAQYLDAVAVEVLIEESAAGEEVSVPTVLTESRSESVNWAWLAFAAIAASLLVAGAWVLFPGNANDAGLQMAKQAPEPSKPEVVGEVIASTKVAAGERLPVTMPSGVEIEVQGPAKFRVSGDNELVLEQGSLVADVPEQGRGFRVVTPNGDVVDLGTRIGVAVDGDHSELHVFEGKAEVMLNADQRLTSLGVHEAVRFHHPDNAGYEPIAINPALFLSKNDAKTEWIEFGFESEEVAWTNHFIGTHRDRGDRPVSPLTTGQGRFLRLLGWVELPTEETQVGTFFNNPTRFAPHSGGGRVLPVPYHCRESLESLLLSSPPFRLARQGGPIVAYLTGGRGLAEAPPEFLTDVPKQSSDQGYMGLALRRVSDGRYLSSVRRLPGNFYDWVRVEISAAELATATAADGPEETYALDLIDTYRGARWSWIGLDSVSVPGQLVE